MKILQENDVLQPNTDYVIDGGGWLLFSSTPDSSDEVKIRSTKELGAEYPYASCQGYLGCVRLQTCYNT